MTATVEGAATESPTRRPGLVPRSPAFLRVWGGQAVGAVTDQLVPVALSLYAVQQGGRVADVGLVLAGRTVALVVCLLLGGLLADRMSRPRLLLGADWARAVVLVGTAFALPWLPIWSLAVVTALLGAGEAVSRPAFRALLPDLLDPSQMETANALVAATQRSAAVLGALGGAVLVATVGARATLAGCGLLLVVGGLLLLGLREDRRRARGPRSARAEYADAVRAVLAHRWVVAVMVTCCLHLMAGSALALATLPVVSVEVLGSEGPYAAALAAMAAGALPGAVLTSRWRPRRPGLVGIGGLVLFALVPLSVAYPFSTATLVTAFALGGFSIEVAFVYWLSALQRTFDSDILGKVFALDQLAAFAMLPAGLVAAGPLVEAFGVRATLTGGALVVVVSTVCCLLVPGTHRLADPPGRPALGAP